MPQLRQTARATLSFFRYSDWEDVCRGTTPVQGEKCLGSERNHSLHRWFKWSTCQYVRTRSPSAHYFLDRSCPPHVGPTNSSSFPFLRFSPISLTESRSQGATT